MQINECIVLRTCFCLGHDVAPEFISVGASHCDNRWYMFGFSIVSLNLCSLNVLNGMYLMVLFAGQISDFVGLLSRYSLGFVQARQM